MSSPPTLDSPGYLVSTMAILGAAGLVIGSLAGSVVFALASIPFSVSATAAPGQVILTLGTYLGMAVIGWLYLLRHDIPLSYVRITRPTRGDLSIAAVTTVVLVALSAAIPILIGWLGLPFTQHTITDTIEATPPVALVFLPLSILLVGPAEEFLYRGVIQTRLKEAFSTTSAVAIASLLFAFVHFFAYLDLANVSGTLITIVLLLLPLGAILGVVYEYTDTLVVPALAHGFYNAITYATVYADVVGLW